MDYQQFNLKIHNIKFDNPFFQNIIDDYLDKYSTSSLLNVIDNSDYYIQNFIFFDLLNNETNLNRTDLALFFYNIVHHDNSKKTFFNEKFNNHHNEIVKIFDLNLNLSNNNDIFLKLYITEYYKLLSNIQLYSSINFKPNTYKELYDKIFDKISHLHNLNKKNKIIDFVFFTNNKTIIYNESFQNNISNKYYSVLLKEIKYFLYKISFNNSHNINPYLSSQDDVTNIKHKIDDFLDSTFQYNLVDHFLKNKILNKIKIKTNNNKYITSTLLDYFNMESINSDLIFFNLSTNEYIYKNKDHYYYIFDNQDFMKNLNFKEFDINYLDNYIINKNYIPISFNYSNLFQFYFFKNSSNNHSTDKVIKKNNRI